MEESKMEVEQTPKPKETSGLAIASLICGIIGLCTFLPGLVALILGIVALGDTKKNEKGGKGMAITGIILGSISIIIVPIAMVAAIAIPGLLRARLAANEGSAMGTLRSLSVSQAQFQSSAMVDQDKDGTGEFGFLQELTGVSNLRGTDRNANPYYMSPTLTPGQNGIGMKSGYHYYIYLPMNQDFTSAMGEAEMKTSTNTDVINAQETRWAAYAWPVRYGETGCRAFGIDQSGELLIMVNAGGVYSGDRKPEFNAAFGKDGIMQAGTGKDGQEWRPGY